MTQLPASLASRQRRSVIADATQGLGSTRGAHLSIRGGRFRLVSSTGAETPLETHHIDIIVIDANDKPARVYFEGEYEPNSDTPPMCYSDNGTGPSTNAMMPQAPSCLVCPHNMRGSDVTFTGKPTTACDNRKKLAFIIPDDEAVNVYEFQVPPGSLSNLRAYGAWIGQQASGIPGRNMDIADFVTRVAFDPDKQFVMTFTPVAFADDDRTIQLIEYIDANKLSDAAVGRNDIACAPEVVQARLAAGQQPAQLAAPAAAPPVQQTQGQQFVMPARLNGGAQAQLSPPPANGAAASPAAPPKPRGGRRGGQTEAPAGASAAAPFMAGAATAAPSAQATQQAPAAATQTAASPSKMDIPPFLQRNADTPPAPSAPPRFGVGAAPPPPAAIADALGAAMQLPTRRA